MAVGGWHVKKEEVRGGGCYGRDLFFYCKVVV